MRIPVFPCRALPEKSIVRLRGSVIQMGIIIVEQGNFRFDKVIIIIGRNSKAKNNAYVYSGKKWNLIATALKGMGRVMK